MSSSSESHDDAFDTQATTKQPKQEQAESRTKASYQNFLTSNNKFSEMLKNKIKQSELSPISLNHSKHKFNPIASSTQLGTPEELKQKEKRPKKLTAGINLIAKQLTSSNSNIYENETIPHEIAEEKSSEARKQTNSDSKLVQNKSKNEDSDQSSSDTDGAAKKADSETQKQNREPSTEESPEDERKSSSSSEEETDYPQLNNKGKPNKHKSSKSSSDIVGNNSKHQSSPVGITNLKNKKSSSEDSDSNSSSDEFVQETEERSKGDMQSVRLKEYDEELSFERLTAAYDFLNDLKSKEEIFLFQVPIQIDPHSLVGVNISLTEPMRIPQRKKYESVPVSETQGNVSLFCDNENDRIRIVKPVRCIKIQRHLKEKSIVEVPDVRNDAVSFPHNLKERHPLFGSEFTNKINLEEHIKQKLAAAVEVYTKKKEKKKKKRSPQKQEQQEEEIFKILNQSVPAAQVTTSKKSKKKKISNAEVEEIVSESKKKHRKFEEQPSTSYGNENFKKKTKKRKDQSTEEPLIGGKKRKYKELDNTSSEKSKPNSENEDSLIKQLLVAESANLHIKKKKKKRKNKDEECLEI